MKAIVHMGLPKTGTTSIQSWLRLNQGTLRSRGIGYDRINLPDHKWRKAHVEIGICQSAQAGVLVGHAQTKSHYGLRDLQAQQDLADRYLQEFQRVITAGSAQTWVFSNEDLGSLTKSPDLAQALDTWMKRTFDDVRYVIYVRRQEDWLLSRYSQVLRRGSQLTLDAFIDEKLRQNYMKTLQAMVDGVGQDRLTVRLLEPDTLVGGDLVQDFAEEIGIDPEDLKTPKRKNEALTVAAAEFLRQANCRWPTTINTFKRPTPILGSLSKTLTSRYAKTGRKLRLRQSQIDAVRTANAGSNDTLRRAFFPDRPVLFPEKPTVSDDPSLNTATVEEIAAIGLDLFRDGRIDALDRLSEKDLKRFKTAEKSNRKSANASRAPNRNKARQNP